MTSRRSWNSTANRLARDWTLYTPQDRHDTYKALGIKSIARADGSTELTGSLFADIHSDSMRMIPNEEYHALAR